ncbi:MAG: DUF4148 domain-containing protein [Rhodoferax sp.]|nr:DUF4148 domain-containing protein [Rhodoferax sp.]
MEHIMIRNTLSILTLAVATLAAGNALADGVPMGKTRAQVVAELEEAQRTGDIVLPGTPGGRKLNELYPERYPAKAVPPGKTRAQVIAELEEAQRTGDIVVSGNVGGRKLNELYPDRYPKK